MREFGEVLKWVAVDGRIRVMILTEEVGRAFVAGADISKMEEIATVQTLKNWRKCRVPYGPLKRCPSRLLLGLLASLWEVVTNSPLLVIYGLPPKMLFLVSLK